MSETDTNPCVIEASNRFRRKTYQPGKAWTTEEWAYAQSLRKENLTFFQIAQRFGRTEDAVCSKFGSVYHDQSNSGKSRPAPIVGSAIINTNTNARSGKVNPFKMARDYLPGRFKETKVGETYNGSLIRGMEDWNKIIQDLNRHLIALGQDQIGYNKEWLV